MDNEQEITLIAVEAEGCKGCVFAVQEEEYHHICNDSPDNAIPCQSGSRKDRKHIIWKVKPVKKTYWFASCVSADGDGRITSHAFKSEAELMENIAPSETAIKSLKIHTLEIEE